MWFLLEWHIRVPHQTTTTNPKAKYIGVSTGTPQLLLSPHQIPTNRDHEARHGGTHGGCCYINLKLKTQSPTQTTIVHINVRVYITYMYIHIRTYIYIYIHMVLPPSYLPFLGEVKEVFRVQGWSRAVCTTLLLISKCLGCRAQALSTLHS